MIVAFENVFVGGFPETRESELVVAAAKKLSKPRAFLGLLGEVFLIGAIPKGCPTQILFLNYYMVGIRS